MGSLCYNTIMSSRCIIFIVIFLKSVNSKVHVVSFSEDDNPVDKYDTRAVGISGFLTRSLTGEAFYFTLFWIVFVSGILIGQLAKDISTYLKPSSSSSNHSVCPATDILDLPPPYKIIEEKGETV